LEPSLHQVPVTPRTADAEWIDPADVPSTTPSSLPTGDDSGVDAAAELRLLRLKDVLIEALLLDHDVHTLKEVIDPDRHRELTHNITTCRALLNVLQAKHSGPAASATHAEGPSTATDQVSS